MTDDDRIRWDQRYADLGSPTAEQAGPAGVFAPYREVFPSRGLALDVACGPGLGAVWLAGRGLTVWGLDVSPVAIEQARGLAERSGVGRRCRFDVVDLDRGLPAGPAVNVVYCARFRDRRLDRVLIERLAPGGLLATCALSEVGGRPGPFRAGPGELRDAFGELEVIAEGEGDGQAWLLGRRR